MSNPLDHNLQTHFIEQIIKAKASMTIFLVNGVKLQGTVTWKDDDTVLLRRNGHAQLVYKHAISTILPCDPLEPLKGEA